MRREIKPFHLLSFVWAVLLPAIAMAENYTVTVHSSARTYSPNRLHVSIGDQIEFRNAGNTREELTIKGFPELLEVTLEPGGTHSFVIDDVVKPGRYHFFSTTESAYKGILIVNPVMDN